MIFISPRKLLTIVLIPNKYDARAVYSALVLNYIKCAKYAILISSLCGRCENTCFLRLRIEAPKI